MGIRSLVMASLLLFATTAMAEESSGARAEAVANGIPEFSAEYELQRNNTRAARLTRTLSCDGAACEFRSKGRTVGLADLLLRGRIDEFTRFRMDDSGGLQPRDYSYRQRARGDNDEYVRLFFNPSSGRVTSRGDEKWESHIDGEVMDELLSQLRLMLAVRAGETEMEFSVVEGDGAEDVYQFEVVGEEKLEIAAGTFEAIKVQRVGGSERRTTEMWFAPDLEYIPLVVKQSRDGGDSYTATLTEILEQPRIHRPDR